MPASDSPALIVARFLKSNNYNDSYEAFIEEAGLPSDAGSVSKGDLTLEVLLEEKKNFDLATQFEKLGTDDDNDGSTDWKLPAPSYPREVSDLPSASNVLSIGYGALSDGSEDNKQSLLVSTADRRLTFIDVPDGMVGESINGLHDAPILSCVVLHNRYMLTTSMSGHLVLSEAHGRILDKRRDHSKYVVKVATFEDHGGFLVATAGWDNKVTIYRPHLESYGATVGEPVCTIELTSKPEAILFLQHRESAQPILLLSRTDSSFLYYYTVTEREPRLIGRQNLAPHSNAWVAFTPTSFALCPKGSDDLLAVATSSIPFMKVLIVRLLIPPYDGQAVTHVSSNPIRTSLLDDSPATETQASQARAALLVQDREAAAILIHCSTQAPQTPYSTPAIAWRPDGSGVWVNGDDGVIRGMEARTGKIVAILSAHEPGTKVRCLWAGLAVNERETQELLVSGGFDQKLILWTP